MTKVVKSCENCGSEVETNKSTEVLWCSGCNDKEKEPKMTECPKCKSDKIIGVEYGHKDPEHYDGVSEWNCLGCGYREGRWSEKELKGDESEKRYGGKE